MVSLSVDDGQQSQKIQRVLGADSFASACRGPAQDVVDNSIIDYIIQDLQPFSKTEGLGFRKLICGLAPARSVISRKTIMERISTRFQTMRSKLKSTLQQQAYVATTTDCWSAHHKSYLGITIHWIDQDTMDKKSAALSCRRLKGSHTFDVLAAALEEIHGEYGIIEKIVITTTDNGSNFCKAFEVFGKENCSDIGTSETGNEGEPSFDMPGASTETDADGPDGIDFTAVDDILASSNGEYRLPVHHRCACHTLNLVATKDACAAEDNAVYKKTFRSTFAKCQALWNKQSRSVQASEVIAEAFGLQLIGPNQTRWNCTYMAVERINRLVTEKGIDVLNSVCDKISLVQFRRTEIAFLSEYATVMKPLATALDILQCETKAFMAYLVPTLVVLLQRLQMLESNANTSLQFCR